jgi:uncharacterized protein
MDRRLGRSFFAAGAVLASATVTEAQTAGVALVESVPSITVGGMAKRDVRPDVAQVKLGVTTNRPRAEDAASDNARAAAAVVLAAHMAGLADRDIRTSQLQLVALPDPHNGAKTQGFRASNQVALSIHDLDRVGAIVGQLVADGANTVEGIDFEVADPEPLLNDLRAAATRDAMTKADIYATAANVTLGRVLRISPDDPAPPMMSRVRALQAPAPAPPVEPGTETIEAHVQVTWELLPKDGSNSP